MLLFSFLMWWQVGRVALALRVRTVRRRRFEIAAAAVCSLLSTDPKISGLAAVAVTQATFSPKIMVVCSRCSMKNGLVISGLIPSRAV